MRFFKAIFIIFLLGLVLIPINNFILAPLNDQLKLMKFEKIATQDKINNDIEWPEHIGVYSENRGVNVFSDIGASLLYGGHTKKVTKHSYNKDGQITESRSYWLEQRDVCPDVTQEKDFILNTTFRRASIFHADMGLCIISKPSKHTIEPIQLISAFKWRPDETKTREFLILNSTIAPDLNPDARVILAKLTKVNYRKAARVRFNPRLMFLSKSLGFYTERDSANFTTSRLPDIPEHILMRTNGTSGHIRYDSTLRYISNIGKADQGKYLNYQDRDKIKNPYELIPSTAEKVLIASKEFAKLSPADFPLNERNARLSSYLTPYGSSTKTRSEIGSDLYEGIVHDVIPAADAELKFLRSKFDITRLKTKKSNPFNTRPMIINLDRMTIPRFEVSLMQSDYSESFKNTLFNIILDIDTQKINIQEDSDERLKRKTIQSMYNLASKIMLEDNEVRHDITSAVLNKVLEEEEPNSSGSDRYYYLDQLLKNKGENFPELTERLIGDVETGKLERWQIVRNFNLIDKMPPESLRPFKTRLLLHLDKHDVITTRLRRKLRKMAD